MSETAVTSKLKALVRAPDPSIADCELTYVPRTAIDWSLLERQHQSYCEALGRMGIELERLDPMPGKPDSVFVEDTALILEEKAIAARPGALSRQSEVDPRVLARFRTKVTGIVAPGTLEGGDVLRIGRRLYVGLSTRTNSAGIDQLRADLAIHGYKIIPVPVSGALHLKTAVTCLGRNTLLINPAWIGPGVFPGFELIETDPAEPFGANALLCPDDHGILYAAEHPRAAARIRARGFRLETTPLSEFAKAEAGVTCLSLVFRPETPNEGPC